MIWLLVLVVCGAVVVFGPGWFEAHEEITLADLLEQVSGEKYLETGVSVKTAKDEHSPMHTATVNQPLSTFYSYGDRYVKFAVVPEEKSTSESTVDAISILMRPKHAKHLPSQHSPVHNNKQLLFNHVCALLIENNVGFTIDEVEGVRRQKDIGKAKTFLKFVDSHCCVRKYSFQVKKCNDPTCCPPSRLSSEVFSKIKWLPDPTFTSDKTHYKTFQELYGLETNENDCPSRTLCREREQEPSSLFTAAKVRGVATCLACDKPRCLYCDKQTIYKDNENIVTLAVESNLYICGSPIFPESHPLSELIRVRTSVSCKSPIERSYYIFYGSLPSSQFRSLCFQHSEWFAGERARRFKGANPRIP